MVFEIVYCTQIPSCTRSGQEAFLFRGGIEGFSSASTVWLKVTEDIVHLLNKSFRTGRKLVMCVMAAATVESRAGETVGCVPEPLPPCC